MKCISSSLALGLTALALVAGCSVPGGTASHPPAGTSTSPASAPTWSAATGQTAAATAQPAASSSGVPASTEVSTSTGVSAATPTLASDTPLPVVATRPLAGHPGLAVQINAVAARDAVTTVTFSVLNQGDRSFQVSQTFSDGVRSKDATGKDLPGDDAFLADGVFVLDTKNAQRYLPGRAPDGTCACSGNLSSVFVEKGASVSLSTVVKALPADVTTVSVFVPGAGVFDNVPVTR